MFRTVLVGLDGRTGGRDAIVLARELMRPGGQLTLAHIYRDQGALGRAAALLLPAEREESLRLLTRERDTADVQAELVTVAAQSVGRGLHDVAVRLGADLLVLGTCRRGAPGRVFFGDDTRSSLNAAPCAVAVAPRDYRGSH
jgi:nucleotide-binding universal stress UspA family protein